MDLEVAELKLELKQWELQFCKKHLRKPTKTDVAEYPDIKEKYELFIAGKRRLQDRSSVSRNHSTDPSEHSLEASPLSNERKVLSPKNSPVQNSNESNIWGANLLKKNTAKKFHGGQDCGGSNLNSLTVPTSRNQPTWRENMRKNIATDTTTRLPTSLKKRTSISRSLTRHNDSLNSTLGLTEDISDSHCNDSIATDVCQMAVPKSSMLPNLPFPTKSIIFGPNLSHTKSSLLSRPIKMDIIGDEDLSDLTYIENTEKCPPEQDVVEKKGSSQVVADGAEKKLPIFKDESSENCDKEPEDESESFIVANFRQNVLPVQEESLKLDYNSICLVPGDDKHEKTAEASVSEVQSGEAVLASGTQTKSKTVTASKGVVQTNFVRLNMKKKCFSKRGGSGVFLRKQVLRQKLAKKGISFKSGWRGRSGGTSNWKGGSGGWKGGGGGFRDKSEDKCFKCGGSGHWASKCRGQGFQKKKTVDPEEEAQNKESLQEILENIDLITAAIKGESSEPSAEKVTVTVSKPVLDDDAVAIAENGDVMNTLNMFKYESFRPGQDKAISRILRGLPTLLVLSTGSGKSLCYQLPAYLYAMQRNAITLVISPLVSLMDDQVRGLPRKMKATRIHSGMTKEQRSKALVEVESGKVHILLVSPEAITSWAGMSAKYSPLSKLPPIAFACIDECHCLSEWSHAFRPSYLRVCQVLRDQLGIKCLVGLTATATMDTCASVARQLGIKDVTDGVIAKIDMPDNLVLSISKDKYKDEALSQLLLGDRFSKLDSVIVYCTRREEASRIASLLRTKMQDMPGLQQVQSESEEEDAEQEAGSKKRKRQSKGKKGAKRKVVTLDAECYHAGMSPAERRRMQNRFMNGTLRVVVATVAFGMGIDKQDVRSIIHYNMPMSFERYVQEVGRAGRDGKPAHCHLFLDSDGGDLYELSRHSYGKSLDRYTIKKFVQKVFPSCKCGRDKEGVNGDSSRVCSGHFSSINIDEAVEDLDVKKEGLETLLCYLEAEKLIQVHLPTEAECSLQFYGGPGQMLRTAKKCPIVAVALKLAGAKENETKLTFNVMRAADELGAGLSSVKKLLRYLTWDTTLASGQSEIGKSGIEVEFFGLSFCLQTKSKAANEFLDAVTDLLHRRVIAQENKEIAQLRLCFNTMQQFSYSNVGNCKDVTDTDKSTQLKATITRYFRETQAIKDVEEDTPVLSAEDDGELRSTIRQFLHVHANDLESKVTGRAIARIFHGIDSPRYPARSWGPARRFWRCKLHLDFNAIRKIATEELIGTVR